MAVAMHRKRLERFAVEVRSECSFYEKGHFAECASCMNKGQELL